MAIPLENVVSISVEGVVEQAIRQSLQFSVEKTSCANVDALISRLRAHDDWALGYFAYSCAHHLAESIAALDGNISEAWERLRVGVVPRSVDSHSRLPHGGT